MNQPLHSLMVAVTAMLAATATAADTLGVRAGLSYWNFDINGSARYLSSDPADDIDVNRDLGFTDDSASTLYISVEHPAPLIPNLKLTSTRIDSAADGMLTQSFNWGNTSFTVNEATHSDVQLDQTGLALYWRILDNTLNLDLGVEARYIDINATITGSTSGSDSADISGVLPMIYAGVGADLPLTGLGISADGSVISYDGNNVYDFSIRASYETAWPLGLEAGYRKMKLDLDNFDNAYANIEFDGPYLGVYLYF